jgi:hypothetical protein
MPLAFWVGLGIRKYGLDTVETSATTTRTVKQANHPPLLTGDRGPMAVSRPGLREAVLKVLQTVAYHTQKTKRGSLGCRELRFFQTSF